MSRIGKKPIPLPAGVKYKVDGNTVLVEGPKGKVSALIAEGITLEEFDKYPLLKVRLKGFRHCYGQPPEVRRAFEEAMGIAP